MTQIEELKRIRSILSAATGLEDDDQEYIEDARRAVDALIRQALDSPAHALSCSKSTNQRACLPPDH
jgi:hypothetical protein